MSSRNNAPNLTTRLSGNFPPGEFSFDEIADFLARISKKTGNTSRTRAAAAEVFDQDHSLLRLATALTARAPSSAQHSSPAGMRFKPNDHAAPAFSLAPGKRFP
ncbi:MAG: hypothetical protein LBU23_11780, partial [Planctomycetota bacterium]|jgi:hypothetical protein|nr:hypothetical protein [Planctomycetota bacterium]